jgi:uncharacterized membrane protein
VDFSGSNRLTRRRMLGALAALPALPALFSGGSARADGMVYGFEAIVFNGKRTARKALDTLEDHAPAYVWIDNVAILSRNERGFVSIYSTWAQDDRSVGAGASWGMITGALLGLMAGPGGALAGAATGGSLGALMGVRSEIMLDDPRLDAFAQALDKDTSALILVGEKPTIADFGAVVEPLGGKIVKTDLNEKDVDAIRKALKVKG